MKLKGKILSFSLPPLILTATVLGIIVSRRVTISMESEIGMSLKATAYVYRDAIADEEENNYYLDEEGCLMNNDYDISDDTTMVDLLKKETDISLTVFYQDTRVITSITDKNGNRFVGSKAGATAIEKVLKGGEEYFAKGIDIEGVLYYGYYIPIYNGTDANNGSKSEIVGMIFAGMEKAVVTETIKNTVKNVFAASNILMLFFIVLDLALANKLSRRFARCSKAIDQISTGDFTVEIHPSVLRSKDESGEIARSVLNLTEKLNETLGGITKESNTIEDASSALDEAAEECAHVIEQVESAVADIATGATSQAADTTDATTKVIEMGDLVEATNDSVENLNDISQKMEAEGKTAATILEKLKNVNEETKSAIDEIYVQTNTTNESALKISEAVNLITAIAEETNLLSLNATIEAARAGEQGRGFAVVASQIQKLAEQSNESAQTIEEIIRTLIADSEKSVETMNQVKEIMDRQSAMVEETGKTFDEVMGGIASSREGINEISSNMNTLNSSRQKVVDIVSNLSAIAEENAASTEETSASVTEVSASVQEVSASAVQLKTISDDLYRLVHVFKIKED